MRNVTKQAERLAAIRSRYTINIHLEDCGVIEPAAIGAAVGLPPTEAVSLLTLRQWRAADVAALRTIAAQLEMEVALPEIDLAVSKAVQRRRSSHLGCRAAI